MKARRLITGNCEAGGAADGVGAGIIEVDRLTATGDVIIAVAGFVRSANPNLMVAVGNVAPEGVGPPVARIGNRATAV